ncbi:hypothetical protein RYX36_027086 [Vicia faba]
MAQTKAQTFSISLSFSDESIIVSNLSFSSQFVLIDGSVSARTQHGTAVTRLQSSGKEIVSLSALCLYRGIGLGLDVESVTD